MLSQRLEELRERGVLSTNWRVDRQLSTPTAAVFVNYYLQTARSSRPMRPSLQPRASQPATPCVPACNPCVPVCNPVRPSL